MLKRVLICDRLPMLTPAAFRRLCVETILLMPLPTVGAPAAFRRLCVETRVIMQAV